MGKVIDNNTFRESIQYYMTVLEKAYVNDVEIADDKEYAKTYWQQVYFLENSMIPYPSTLFQELLVTFNHLEKLNSSASILMTQELLEGIRDIALDNLNTAKNYLSGDKNLKLNSHYINNIDLHDISLEESIAKEQKVLDGTNENLIGALAIHLAGQQLYNKYNQSDTALGEVDQQLATDSGYEHQFTRNEQVLSLFFLIESTGVNIFQQADRTKMTALFHSMLGMPIKDMKKLKNTSIYKALSIVPQIGGKEETLLKYLKHIRSFFAEANFHKTVDLIDKQIEICKSELG